MEELTDSLLQQHSRDGSSNGVHANDDNSGGTISSRKDDSSSYLPDYIPLNKSGQEDPNKPLVQSHNRHTEERDTSEEDAWEDQLAKRAGVQLPHPSAPSAASAPHDKRTTATTTPPPASKVDTEKLLNMLSYDTVKRSLRSQISGLAGRSELAESKLRALESSLETHRAEAAALRKVVDKKSSQMEFLQVWGWYRVLFDLSRKVYFLLYYFIIFCYLTIT